MKKSVMGQIKNLKFIGSWQILLNKDIAVKRLGMICTYIQIPKEFNKIQKSLWRREKTLKRIKHHIKYNHSERGKTRQRTYKDTHKETLSERTKKRCLELGYMNQIKWQKLNYSKIITSTKLFYRTDKGQEYYKNYRKNNRNHINEIIAKHAKTPRGQLLIYENHKRQFEKHLKNFNNTIEFEVISMLNRWSMLIRNRDKMCLICGTKENLLAHHLIHKAVCPKLMFNLNNGMTICTDCHYEHHYGHKGGIIKSLTATHTEIKENKMEGVALLV